MNGSFEPCELSKWAVPKYQSLVVARRMMLFAYLPIKSQHFRSHYELQLTQVAQGASL